MKTFVLLIAMGISFVCSFCAASVNQFVAANNFCPTGSETQEGERDAEVVKEIENLLTKQAAAWNAGDLSGFMQTYWNSDKLTFSAGGKTTRGWQATLDRYVQSYAPPKEMGTLTFDHLETTLIEKNAALILGDWHLKMEKGENRNGNFSLVLRKIQGEWRIIHDHSSTLEKEPADNHE